MGILALRTSASSPTSTKQATQASVGCSLLTQMGPANGSLCRQTRPYLSKGQIAWDMLHPDLYRAVRSHECAGVQIADIAASAFYQALHSEHPGWDVTYAKALGPRLARDGRVIANHGLTLMPFQSKLRRLNERQREVFEYFGFEFEEGWRAPASVAPQS